MSRSLLAHWPVRVAGLTVLLVFGSVAHGQVCVGDCNGDQQVAVNELVRGVNIALGAVALGECPTFDQNHDGRVLVNELVRAVADLLYGCGVMPPTPVPTHTPTSTPTSTGTPTLAPTPTSGPLDISGVWRDDMRTFVASTCNPSVTDILKRQLDAQPPCTDTVTQSGALLTVVDCNGASGNGEIDRFGIMHLHGPPQSDTQNGCTVSGTEELIGDMTHSPATVRDTITLSFSGTCPLPACTFVSDMRWTRL